jgi:hypothetical protein
VSRPANAEVTRLYGLFLVTVEFRSSVYYGRLTVAIVATF